MISHWMGILKQAQTCYEQHPELEEVGLCALADLYRQGHNLGVRNCAQNADQALRICLEKFPESIRANQIGAYFYISVPTGGSQGEKCLLKLQRHYGVGKEEEVERGLVFAFLNQQRLPEALEQANRYLDAFGQHEVIVGIKKGIENNTMKLVQQPTC